MSYKPEGSSASSPYAALSTSPAAPALVPAQGPATLASMLQKSATPPYLVEEALKLEDIKGAIWATFKASQAAIPMPLVIDLATAYTNALRLQMNLISHPPIQPRPTAEPRTVTVQGKLERKPGTL